jgi:hypothetical protein
MSNYKLNYIFLVIFLLSVLRTKGIFLSQINFLGGIIQIDISFSPMTVNSNSQYSFVLYLSTQIVSSDVIKITFPSQVILQTGTRNCFAVSRKKY